jgi:hypothetical protein
MKLVSEVFTPPGAVTLRESPGSAEWGLDNLSLLPSQDREYVAAGGAGDRDCGGDCR